MELDLGAGIGLVAQLVLEALDADGVDSSPPDRALRQHARQEQAADRPLVVCARIRKASHMGAEKNHLCPVTLKRWPQVSLPQATARVVLARTSLPPCFSVMPMPIVRPALSRQIFRAGS
jgi:hypothetical protein